MIHNSGLAMISSAGHLTNLEQPDAFNTLVGEFVRGVDSRG
jgi:pimeloyl-ACP methyl ester carboxylesterase